MTNVVRLPVDTTLDIPVERVLERAMAEDLSSVIVIGRDANGDLVLLSSESYKPDLLWDVEAAKRNILDDE